MTTSRAVSRSRADRPLVVMAAALVAAALNATGATMPAHAATAPCSLQWGMYEPSTPWDSSMSRLQTIDGAVNRHSSIVHWYASWGDPGSGTFNLHQPALLNTVRTYSSVGVRGSKPLITWEPWGPPYSVTNNQFPLAQIATGAYDSYIDSWATGLRAYGRAVMIDFAHEMDANWFPWGYGVNGNTASDYIAAFRHVHDRFRADGASNVQFVWDVNVWNPSGADPRAFYPGDGYVDWMAIDGYNWGANGGGWATLGQALTVVQTYSRVASLNSTRPMMLAEWASAEPTPQDPPGVTKGAWIQDAAQALTTQFTRITAVVWFSYSGSTFALDSSADSLSGARTAFGGCGED